MFHDYQRSEVMIPMRDGVRLHAVILKPAALESGSIREYKFSLHDVDHVFKAGHTVMVEIQSTWFPFYDRKPQTFVPNIMKARSGDYRPASISIYSGPGHDSALEVPLVSTCGRPDCD